MITKKQLVIGKVYSYVSKKNSFKVIGLHGEYVWVQWIDDKEIDTIFIQPSQLEDMTLIAQE